MTNTSLKQFALVILLLLTNFQLEAASATATVSANVVPNTSFAMTGSIILSNNINNIQNEIHTKLNNINVVTSSFNNNKSARVKINASHNANYDISISPSPPIINGKSNKIKFHQLEIQNSFNSLNNNREQDLIIEAIIEDADANDTGAYIGTIEINVNYN